MGRTGINGLLQAVVHKVRRTRLLYFALKMRATGGFKVGSSFYRMPTCDDANEQMRRSLEGGNPLLVARFGYFEFEACLEGARKDPHIAARAMKKLHNNAGFFPQDPNLVGQFASTYLRAASDIDKLAVWLFRHGYWDEERQILERTCPTASIMDIRALEPFSAKSPWTAALADKKVLVIHPFAKTIESQYAKRQLLFSKSDVLPEFRSLETIKAVQSIAGNTEGYKSWFDALDAMKQQINKSTFDVALIGAGAYGLPLASHVKQLGKMAVHMGGATQLLFGIMGKRWEDKYGHLANSHWVRPSPTETPSGYSQVEGGCYW